MRYNILEAKIEFENNRVQRITVLVDMSIVRMPGNDVRAIYATTKPANGYMHIWPGLTLDYELLQKVAAAGMETVDRDEIFPNWRSKYFPSKKWDS